MIERCFGSTRWPAALLVALLGAASVAILTRNLFHHPPTYDELVHILAARGVAATGEPVIADGVYDRAELYTRTVAFVGKHVNDELLAARLPAWFAALALVGLVGAWATRRAGWFAGLTAAALLATHPWTINLAVFARFYTMHAWAVFMVFICVYAALTSDRRLAPRTLYAVIAIAALAFALHLQISTVIAAGALGAGLLAGFAVERSNETVRLLRCYPVPIAVACILILAVGIFVLYQFDFVDEFSASPVWSQGAAQRINFYNHALAIQQPLFWPLAPFAALAVCIAWPRLGVTLLIAAALALTVHSLAAAKASRYVYYCLPFVCILLGAGLSRAVLRLTEDFTRRWPTLAKAAPALVMGMLAVSIAASQEGYRSLRLLVGADPYTKVLSYGDESDWSRARPTLAPFLDGRNALVTSNGMKAIYYLGRYDYELNASIVAETDTRREFGRDERTGSRAISAPQSLARIFAQYPQTLIVIEREKLGLGAAVPAQTLAVIQAACIPLAVPSEAGLAVWQCPNRKEK